MGEIGQKIRKLCQFLGLTYSKQEKEDRNPIKSRFLSSLLLFPLYGRWWFTCNVIDHAVNMGYFVNNAGADDLQHFPR